MSLHTIELTAKLSDAEIAAVREYTRARSPETAVAALFKGAVKHATLRTKYRRPHTPNAATARALSSKAPGREIRSRAEFSKWLKTIPSR